MTTQAKGLRRLRKNLPDGVPDQLAQWFRGEISVTWYTMLPWECDLLGVRWRSWKARHPDAVPPRDFEWLDDPSDARHPSADAVRTARRMLARTK